MKYLPIYHLCVFFSLSLPPWGTKAATESYLRIAERCLMKAPPISHMSHTDILQIPKRFWRAICLPRANTIRHVQIYKIRQERMCLKKKRHRCVVAAKQLTNGINVDKRSWSYFDVDITFITVEGLTRKRLLELWKMFCYFGFGLCIWKMSLVNIRICWRKWAPVVILVIASKCIDVLVPKTPRCVNQSTG